MIVTGSLSYLEQPQVMAPAIASGSVLHVGLNMGKLRGEPDYRRTDRSMLNVDLNMGLIAGPSHLLSPGKSADRC